MEDREKSDAPDPRPEEPSVSSRREFLATAALVGGPLLVSSKVAFAAEANSRVTLGAIGCGGRGTWIGELFQKHGGYQITAAADYFQEKVDGYGDKLQVPAARRFTGLSGYQRLLESDVDAVVIQSPPFFHPRQAADGVAAGKHVYLAKPIAVDVPGCRTVEESGRKAGEKKRVFLIDFQTRTDPFYREAVKRSQYGDIGRIVCGEAVYVCGPTWGDQAKWLTEKPNDPELRLRAWGLDRALSGDVITEQNIHALDVATWVLDAVPLSAVGTGGRGARKAGTCWDHFSVVYRLPAGRDHHVLLEAARRRGRRHLVQDVWHRRHLRQPLLRRGRHPRQAALPGREDPEPLHGRRRREHRRLPPGDRRRDFTNPTVAPSVRSNLTTILGRTAAYRGAKVTWDEMMAGAEKLEADLSGLRS